MVKNYVKGLCYFAPNILSGFVDINKTKQVIKITELLVLMIKYYLIHLIWFVLEQEFIKFFESSLQIFKFY